MWVENATNWYITITHKYPYLAHAYIIQVIDVTVKSKTRDNNK